MDIYKGYNIYNKLKIVMQYIIISVKCGNIAIG